MRRFAILSFVLLAMVVAGGCGKFGKTGSNGGGSTTSTDKTKEQLISTVAFTSAVQAKYGCTKPETLDVGASGKHTPGENDKVTYKDFPPAGGEHNPVPVDWGLYKTEQPIAHLVHNMEHGHIVMLYKGLSKADEAKLFKLAKKDEFHLVTSPMKRDPKDGVYYMAWGHRIFCKHPNGPALQYAIDKWRDAGPELFMNDRQKGH
jgi:hypothetical protein